MAAATGARLESRLESTLVTNQPQFSVGFFKIGVVGDRHSGKSSFIERVTQNKFDDQRAAESTSKDICYQKKATSVKVYDYLTAKVEFVDFEPDYLEKLLNEYEESQQLKKSEFFDLSGMFLVYDATDKQTFLKLTDYLTKLRRVLPPDCEISIIATKCDLRPKMEKHCVKFDEANGFTKQHGFSLFETSSKTGLNCQYALLDLVDKIHERQEEVKAHLCDGFDDIEEPFEEKFSSPESIFCRLFSFSCK